MTIARNGGVLETVRGFMHDTEGGKDPDSLLLERFRAGQDPDAFAALVERHGPLVLGVCQRVLQNLHDAEDAFQATFLVLVRKVGSGEDARQTPMEPGRDQASRLPLSRKGRRAIRRFIGSGRP